MTRDDFIDEYGDVAVTFSSYYKFTFTFAGSLENGDKITVDVGGNSDEIYRFEVSPDQVRSVAELDPYAGSVWHDGEEVEGFYDY